MKSKLIKLLSLAIIITLSIITLAIATSAATDIRVTLNGDELTFDVAPQIIDDRTMVPMRAIFEAMGAEVEWDSDTQTITATQGDTIIIMQIDNAAMSVSRQTIELDVGPMLIDGRTLVPVRAVAEGLDADVWWDAGARTVVVTSEPPSETQDEDEPVDIFVGSCEVVDGIRYFFEQQRFPKIVFGYAEEFIDLIQAGDIAEIDEVVRTEWYFISAGVIAEYLMSQDERYSHDDIPRLIEGVTRKRVELGLGEEHVVSVTLEQINASTSAIVIQMYDIEIPPLSTFIAIVYNEASGLHYFTLERSMDWFGDSNAPHFFCFVTPSERGTFFIIENSRAAFMYAIRLVIEEEMAPMATFRAS